MIIIGACYQYDTDEDEYDNTAGFLWKWTKDQAIKYFRDSKKEKFVYGDSNGLWKNLGFMGHNFLYNDDGIVFSLPLALSKESEEGGSESGTIILKTDTGKRFLQI